MRLYYKQHALNLLGDAEVYDQYNHIAYSVKGQLAFSAEFRLYDARMHAVGTVKRSSRSFAPKFDVFLELNYIGSISKEMSFGHPPIYHIDYNGWTIKAANFEKEYFFFDADGRSIGHVYKDMSSVGDAYVMEIIDDADADGVFDADPISFIMFIVAIDAEKAARTACV